MTRPGYTVSEDWADAQADLSLHWAHNNIVGFVPRRLICRWNYPPLLKTLQVIKQRQWYISRVCHSKWAPSSEFVSSSIPSWQILTAHAQPFRGARVLAFCLKVPLDSLLVWASSGGSGETARMRRLAWTFAARIGDKYQIRLTRPKPISPYAIDDKPNKNWF